MPLESDKSGAQGCGSIEIALESSKGTDFYMVVGTAIAANRDINVIHIVEDNVSFFSGAGLALVASLKHSVVTKVILRCSVEPAEGIVDEVAKKLLSMRNLSYLSINGTLGIDVLVTLCSGLYNKDGDQKKASIRTIDIADEWASMAPLSIQLSNTLGTALSRLKTVEVLVLKFEKGVLDASEVINGLKKGHIKPTYLSLDFGLLTADDMQKVLCEASYIESLEQLIINGVRTDDVYITATELLSKFQMRNLLVVGLPGFRNAGTSPLTVKGTNIQIVLDSANIEDLSACSGVKKENNSSFGTVEDLVVEYSSSNTGRAPGDQAIIIESDIKEIEDLLDFDAVQDKDPTQTKTTADKFKHENEDYDQEEDTLPDIEPINDPLVLNHVPTVKSTLRQSKLSNSIMDESLPEPFHKYSERELVRKRMEISGYITAILNSPVLSTLQELDDITLADIASIDDSYPTHKNLTSVCLPQLARLLKYSVPDTDKLTNILKDIPSMGNATQRIIIRNRDISEYMKMISDIKEQKILIDEGKLMPDDLKTYINWLRSDRQIEDTGSPINHTLAVLKCVYKDISNEINSLYKSLKKLFEYYTACRDKYDKLRQIKYLCPYDLGILTAVDMLRENIRSYVAAISNNTNSRIMSYVDMLETKRILWGHGHIINPENDFMGNGLLDNISINPLSGAQWDEILDEHSRALLLDALPPPVIDRLIALEPCSRKRAGRYMTVSRVSYTLSFSYNRSNNIAPFLGVPALYKCIIDDVNNSREVYALAFSMDTQVRQFIETLLVIESGGVRWPIITVDCSQEVPMLWIELPSLGEINISNICHYGGLLGAPMMFPSLGGTQYFTPIIARIPQNEKQFVILRAVEVLSWAVYSLMCDNVCPLDERYPAAMYCANTLTDVAKYCKAITDGLGDQVFTCDYYTLTQNTLRQLCRVASQQGIVSFFESLAPELYVPFILRTPNTASLTLRQIAILRTALSNSLSALVASGTLVRTTQKIYPLAHLSTKTQNEEQVSKWLAALHNNKLAPPHGLLHPRFWSLNVPELVRCISFETKVLESLLVSTLEAINKDRPEFVLPILCAIGAYSADFVGITSWDGVSFVQLPQLKPKPLSVIRGPEFACSPTTLTVAEDADTDVLAQFLLGFVALSLL